MKPLHRLYADFLMPERLQIYAGLLGTARANGYVPVTMSQFLDQIRRGITASQRLLVMRHDIDTDPEIVPSLLAIEQQFDVRATYYFRVTTALRTSIDAVVANGSEASYHFEEVATVAKLHGLRDPLALRARWPEIEALFHQNTTRFAAAFGVTPRIVASHGDFVNRALGITNAEILQNADLRADLGIEAEVYDAAFSGAIAARFSDRPYPQWWAGGDPLASLKAGQPVVYILLHPRHWRSRPFSNVMDDGQRAFEGTLFKARRPNPRARRYIAQPIQSSGARGGTTAG